MTRTRKNRSRVEPRNSAEWLSAVLADAPKLVAQRPTPEAVRRMRRRLLAQIKRPDRAAA